MSGVAKTSSRVLIAGGGPVGLTLGILLQHVYKIPVDIVERQMQPTQHPQAHFMNLRTMEILRTHLPTLHDRVLDAAAPPHQWRDYVYCSRVIHGELARIDQFGPDIKSHASSPRFRNELVESLDRLSPTQPVHFPQHKFESLLSDYAAECGVHIQRGEELKGLHVSPDGIDVTLTQRRERYDYVIGADGAHSRVRSLLQIPMEGPPPLQSLVNVHFTSHALTHHARTAPAMLYFVFNPSVIGVLIAHDLAKGEWVFQIPCFPIADPQAEYPLRRCVELIQQAATGGADAGAIDVTIHSIGGWKMTAQVARDYAAAGNRLFLVGDAAHQFPPAGGFGMNTGIQDAHNLAWKVALAARDEQRQLDTKGAMSLLASYHTERHTVAKATTQLSLRNFERTLRVPSALHVSYDSAKQLNTLTHTSLFQRWLPTAMQTSFVASAIAAGSAHLATLDNPASAFGQRLKRRVQEIVGRHQALGMLFYHADIGYSYKRPNIVWSDVVLDHAHRFCAERSASPEENATTTRLFAPRLEIGGRMPHLWLSPRDGNARVVSTLDLPQLALRDDATPRFVLLVQRATYARLKGTLSDGLDVVVLAAKTDQDDESIDDVDATVYFFERNDVMDAAVLVRPDGHVACRWDDRVSATSIASAWHAAQHGSL
ncbi:Aste57867_14558 [Aphanomyces stellatus]|uniref:Aste57867_14558 protein n=1 Tax=Aphanomyces stellatus TaxID=120398 RepID=A0A485L1J0_9STRA|nr:hypothetical protein As57867_014504 [Aphanomyces stellatus]VFT91378.1 Aste57867_14558 [Aphanomyces stellatus]